MTCMWLLIQGEELPQCIHKPLEITVIVYSLILSTLCVKLPQLDSWNFCQPFPCFGCFQLIRNNKQIKFYRYPPFMDQGFEGNHTDILFLLVLGNVIGEQISVQKALTVQLAADTDVSNIPRYVWVSHFCSLSRIIQNISFDTKDFLQ